MDSPATIGLIAFIGGILFYLRWQCKGLKGASASLYLRRLGPFILAIISIFMIFLSVEMDEISIFWAGSVLSVLSMGLMIAFYRRDRKT